VPDDKKPETEGKQADLFLEQNFTQDAIEYDVRGTRRWTDLSGKEQDEYILACFQGEATRAKAEQRLDLYDRIAASIAGSLLGVFYQYDDASGVSHYEPEDSARAERVTTIRASVLSDTILGKRLRLALSRRRVASPDYSQDPQLIVYSVAPATAGMEILSEACTGEFVELPTTASYKNWNDFAALEVMQGQHLQQRKDEHWNRQMRQRAVIEVPKTSAMPVVSAEHVAGPAGEALRLILASYRYEHVTYRRLSQRLDWLVGGVLVCGMLSPVFVLLWWLDVGDAKEPGPVLLLVGIGAAVLLFTWLSVRASRRRLQLRKSEIDRVGFFVGCNRHGDLVFSETDQGDEDIFPFERFRAIDFRVYDWAFTRFRFGAKLPAALEENLKRKPLR